jgi:hypothetical protein
MEKFSLILSKILKLNFSLVGILMYETCIFTCKWLFDRKKYGTPFPSLIKVATILFRVIRIKDT